MSWNPRLVVALVALTLATGAAPAVAEYLEHYKGGLSAAESENWAEVRNAMDRAIAIQPDSKLRVNKALYFKRYVPYFYLGLAHYKLGDCAAALAAWAEAEEQGVVQKTADYGYVETGRDDCERRFAEMDSSLSRARSLVSSAEVVGAGTRRRLDDLQDRDIEGWQLLDRRLRQAESDLAEAERLIRRQDPSPEDLERSITQATDARDEFKSIRVLLSRQLETLATEQLAVRADLNRVVAASFQSLKNTQHLSPYPLRISELRSQVEVLVGVAGELDPEAPTEEVEMLAIQLEEAITVLDQAVVAPPAELQSAAVAYLAGQYGQVLEILTVGDETPPKIAAQAHLLRAAALFTQYHLDGATDPALLEQATLEVTAYQGLETALPTPSPKYFSPRFLAFFEAQGDTSADS